MIRGCVWKESHRCEYTVTRAAYTGLPPTLHVHVAGSFCKLDEVSNQLWYLYKLAPVIVLLVTGHLRQSLSTDSSRVLSLSLETALPLNYKCETSIFFYCHVIYYELFLMAGTYTCV